MIKKMISKLSVVMLLIFGLIMFFYPILINTSNMFGNMGDVRFITYVLEHFYKWITHQGLHTSFWDMPFFYPYKNTLAFSDVMLGGIPFYIPFRIFGISPFGAIQGCSVLVQILNFIAFYFLMKKTFKFEDWISGAAAFLFTFALPRHNQFMHVQLLFQFFMVFAILAFSNINIENSNLKNHFLFLITSLMFVLQIYTCFYYGWFMVFGGILALIIGLCFKNSRDKIIEFVKIFNKKIIIYVIITFLLLLPLSYHYLIVDGRFTWTYTLLIKPFSFLVSQSWIDSKLCNFSFDYNMEAWTGIGFLSTILIYFGMLQTRFRYQLFLFTLLIVLFFYNVQMNKFIYDYFPGGTAIRAGGRCILFLLPVFAYSLAVFLKKMKNQFLAICLFLLILIEQIPNVSGFSWQKTDHYQRLLLYNIPKDCQVFYYRTKKDVYFDKSIYDIDLMWKADEENKYTANGYSGFMPSYVKDSVPENCIFETKK